MEVEEMEEEEFEGVRIKREFYDIDLDSVFSGCEGVLYL